VENPSASSLLETLLIAVIIGLIPAWIAKSKGRNDFFLWWVFGALLWIVALPCAIFLKPDRDAIARAKGEIKCPNCAEYVKDEAKICRYCHSSLVLEPRP